MAFPGSRRKPYSCYFRHWTLGQLITERQCLPYFPYNLTPSVGKTNDSVGRQKRGRNCSASWSTCTLVAAAGKPITPVAELCLTGVRFTEIFIGLAEHYHWQFLWVAWSPESFFFLQGMEGWGRRNKGSHPPKNAVLKKKWLGFLPQHCSVQKKHGDPNSRHYSS